MNVGAAGYVIGDTLSRILPKSFSHAAVKSAASVYARYFSKDVSAIFDNLRHALPAQAKDSEIEHKVHELIVNFSGYLVDLFYAERFNEYFIRDHVQLLGRNHLDEALEKKRGVIITTAHIGNWELGGMTLARLGYPFTALALKHRDRRIDSIFQRRRQASGLTIIPVGSSLRTCYRALRENALLGVIGDRLFWGEGIPARFLGRTIDFPAGLARISLSSGAPVVPCYFVARSYNRYELEIQPPLRGASENEILQDFAWRTEAKIRQYPTQWFIFQRFWEAPEWPI